MELNYLNKFVEQYKLTKNDKLIKYLLILGIGFVKQRLEDINNEAIKLLANSQKQKSIHQELKNLRNKVLSLKKHIQPEQQIKYHSQPKLMPSKVTPKISEQNPLQQNVKKAILNNHFQFILFIISQIINFTYQDIHQHQYLLFLMKFQLTYKDVSQLFPRGIWIFRWQCECTGPTTFIVTVKVGQSRRSKIKQTLSQHNQILVIQLWAFPCPRLSYV